ncbi:nucleotide sugar dehydrogenase domain protein, partial [Bacteroides fragilis str. 3988 T1]
YPNLDAIVLSVAHNVFQDLDISSLLKENHVIFDVKCILDKTQVDGRL